MSESITIRIGKETASQIRQLGIGGDTYDSTIQRLLSSVRRPRMVREEQQFYGDNPQPIHVGPPAPVGVLMDDGSVRRLNLGND